MVENHMEEKKLELVMTNETIANADEAGDILGQLHARGLLHISDTVLGHLGFSSLLALAASCQLQYVVFAHWMLCCPVGYVERGGPYLP